MGGGQDRSAGRSPSVAAMARHRPRSPSSAAGPSPVSCSEGGAGCDSVTDQHMLNGRSAATRSSCGAGGDLAPEPRTANGWCAIEVMDHRDAEPGTWRRAFDERAVRAYNPATSARKRAATDVALHLRRKERGGRLQESPRMSGAGPGAFFVIDLDPSAAMPQCGGAPSHATGSPDPPPTKGE